MITARKDESEDKGRHDDIPINVYPVSTAGLCLLSSYCVKGIHMHARMTETLGCDDTGEYSSCISYPSIVEDNWKWSRLPYPTSTRC